MSSASFTLDLALLRMTDIARVRGKDPCGHPDLARSPSGDRIEALPLNPDQWS